MVTQTHFPKDLGGVVQGDDGQQESTIAHVVSLINIDLTADDFVRHFEELESTITKLFRCFLYLGCTEMGDTKVE